MRKDSRFGTGWVLSKLFDFTESRFKIEQNGMELSARLYPMPPLHLVLDGKEHAWGIQIPLFSTNWTYRAWPDGRTITLRHEIDNQRLVRVYWCDDFRERLFSTCILELWDSRLNKFVEKSRVNQVAVRQFEE